MNRKEHEYNELTGHHIGNIRNHEKENVPANQSGRIFAFF